MMLMYHRGEYEMYCHQQNKSVQTAYLGWNGAAQKNAPPETANMAKKNYSILACRPVDKENNTTGSAQWKKE